MTSPDPNLLEAIRCLRAAQALAQEAAIYVQHAEGLDAADKEQMSHYVEQNAVHLGLSAGYGLRRMLRGGRS